LKDFAGLDKTPLRQPEQGPVLGKNRALTTNKARFAAPTLVCAFEQGVGF
jgi:hypothetical protein